MKYMVENVFMIAERGKYIIFHWLYYMISGLADIPDLQNLSKPIKFTVPTPDEEFQYETFELLKPDFEYISDTTGYNIIHLPGAQFIHHNCYDKIHDYYYKFLREQILIKKNLNIETQPFRYIYISRNKSHLLKCNHNNKRRQLLNENDVYEILKKYNFEFIYLEDLKIKEKIKLFQEAKCIITPNGGALSFAAFAHKNTQIIELHTSNITHNDQYNNIAIVLNIPITRYTNVTSNGTGGGCDNINICINDLLDFENFIQQYL